MSNKTIKRVARKGVIAALDVGTTKVACFIARAEPDLFGAPQVIGTDHRKAKGMREGIVVDMEAAEEAIRATVARAEMKAGVNIESVILSLSGPHLKSQLIDYNITVANHQISEADLQRVLDPMRLQATLSQDRALIHALPAGYIVDGTGRVRDPRGMYAEQLSVNITMVDAAAGPLRNLIRCVNRCHLEVSSVVACPYAAGLASLTKEERELGVTLIDMGGETTSAAVFYDDEMIHTSVLTLGGVHVTNDLVCGLDSTFAAAERTKNLYASAVSSPSDAREVVTVAVRGEANDNFRVTRSRINSIVQPRLEEIFEMVRDALIDAGVRGVGDRRLVLTGGGAQMPRICELATTIFNSPVRIARPRRIQGLTETTSGPAFAVVAGLLNHATDRAVTTDAVAFSAAQEQLGPLGRIGHWLREHF